MTRTSSWAWYGVLLLVGAGLSATGHLFPASLPVFLPWEFHWVEFLAIGLILAWFWHGLQLLPGNQRPAPWRRACFVAGILSFYIVLQTHIDYYAPASVLRASLGPISSLHHAGAFLIALGMSGPALYAGMPDFLKPLVTARPVKAVRDVLQHPAIAPMLFVGLLYFWLIPAIHTRVMLDENLYMVMNWTMAINGVMFWSLVLDSRPKPPARLSHLMRALMILLIELPQMVLGAILSLSMTDFYPVYNICGRVLDMTPLNDQHYGGLIIWLPGTLTSFAAMIVVLVTMRLNEEKAERARV